MKKLLYVLIVFLFFNLTSNADVDYRSIYNGLENPEFSYIHGIDPDQYYDMQQMAWSPYPLFRLNSEVYFKKQVIPPGYYLLTPREHDGKWYILFKENGTVKATIPCYKHEIVPETFYKDNLPKEKLTPTQKIHIGFVHFVSSFNSAGRKKAPSTYLEIEDVDNDYLSIILYYGSWKYYIVLRNKIMQ